MDEIIKEMRKEAQKAADVGNYDLYGILIVYAGRIEEATTNLYYEMHEMFGYDEE